MAAEASYIQEGHRTAPSHPDESGRFHSGDSMLLLGLGYFSDLSMAAAIERSGARAQRMLVGRVHVFHIREPADQTRGDRVCGVKDSSGKTWWIATHTVLR